MHCSVAVGVRTEKKYLAYLSTKILYYYEYNKLIESCVASSRQAETDVFPFRYYQVLSSLGASARYDLLSGRTYRHNLPRTAESTAIYAVIRIKTLGTWDPPISDFVHKVERRGCIDHTETS